MVTLFATKDPTCFKLLCLKCTFPVVLICVWVQTSWEQGLLWLALEASSPQARSCILYPLPSSILTSGWCFWDPLPGQLLHSHLPWRLTSGAAQTKITHIHTHARIFLTKLRAQKQICENTIFFSFHDNLIIIYPHSIWSLKEIGVNPASLPVLPQGVRGSGASGTESAAGSGGCWAVLSFPPLLKLPSSLGLQRFILRHPQVCWLSTPCLCCSWAFGVQSMLSHHVMWKFTGIGIWDSMKVGVLEFKVYGCWTHTPESSFQESQTLFLSQCIWFIPLKN